MDAIRRNLLLERLKNIMLTSTNKGEAKVAHRTECMVIYGRLTTSTGADTSLNKTHTDKGNDNT